MELSQDQLVYLNAFRVFKHSNPLLVFVKAVHAPSKHVLHKQDSIGKYEEDLDKAAS